MVFHRKEKNFFDKEVINGKSSHAYIVEGDGGIGKYTFALYAAESVLTSGSHEKSVSSKVMTLSHPDLHVTNPIDNKIPVDAIREIKKTLTVMPNEGDKKVYIIRHGETMNVQAQNALLKFFEEPPESNVFFLLTEKREALLPTVISRGRFITLHPIDKNEILSFLKEKYPKKDISELSTAASLSFGSPGKAESMLEKKYMTLKNDVLDFGKKAFFGSRYDAISFFKKAKYDRNKAKEFVSMYISLLGDIIKSKEKSTEFSLLTLTDASEFSKTVTIGRLIRMTEEAYLAMERLEKNSNVNLTMTVFAFRVSLNQNSSRKEI